MTTPKNWKPFPLTSAVNKKGGIAIDPKHSRECRQAGQAEGDDTLHKEIQMTTILGILLLILICGLFLALAPLLFDWFFSVEDEEPANWKDRPFIHPWERE